MVLLLGLFLSYSFSEVHPIFVTEKKDNVFVSPGLSLQEPYFLSSEERYLQEPNISYAGGTNRPRFLQIRGVGESSFYENTPSASVGYFLNHIDLTGLMAVWPQLNTASMNVLRGPQSVFYGGSAIGGVVEGSFSSPGSPGKMLLSYENGDSQQAGVDIPLGEKGRFFFSHNRSNGFYRNTFNGSAGAALNELFTSFEVELVNTAEWQLSSTVLGVHAQNALDMWSLKNTFETQSDQPGEDRQKIFGQSLLLERKLNSGDRWVSLTSVTFSQSTYSYDADWGNNPYWLSIAGWNQNYDYFDSFRRQRGVWHEKLYWQRGESKAGVHLYGLSELSEVVHFKDKNIKSFNNGHYEAQSAAAFADLVLPAGESKNWIISARFEKQNIKYSDDLLEEVPRGFDFIALALGFRKRINDSLKSQVKVSRGFKSAGVNIESSLPSAYRFYRPEYATNYEANLEYSKKSFSAIFNLFFNDQTDKQVKVSRQDDPMDPSTFSYFTSNAARVQAYGVEGSVSQFWDRWGIEARVAGLRSSFLHYNFENQDLSGRTTATSPAWSYSLGLSRYWQSGFSATASVSGKSSYYYSNNHNQKSGDFNIVNLGAGYTGKKWEFHIWTKNIFNRFYETRGFYFANEPPDWENKLYVQYGLPRRFGASMGYLF